MVLVQEISPAVIPNSTKIFVNGSWVGIHRDPELLVRTLRQLRRQVYNNTGFPWLCLDLVGLGSGISSLHAM
jgi:hypothetical protein